MTHRTTSSGGGIFFGTKFSLTKISFMDLGIHEAFVVTRLNVSGPRTDKGLE